MIAEWFYWLTGEIGRCFNNATLMRDHTYEEDIVVGTFAIWFILFMMFLLFICSFILWRLSEKENKE